jgi:hypothetical protein
MPKSRKELHILEDGYKKKTSVPTQSFYTHDFNKLYEMALLLSSLSHLPVQVYWHCKAPPD